jgi:hypothetical protein
MKSTNKQLSISDKELVELDTYLKKAKSKKRRQMAVFYIAHPILAITAFYYFVRNLFTKKDDNAWKVDYENLLLYTHKSSYDNMVRKGVVKVNRVSILPRQDDMEKEQHYTSELSMDDLKKAKEALDKELQSIQKEVGGIKKYGIPGGREADVDKLGKSVPVVGVINVAKEKYRKAYDIALTMAEANMIKNDHAAINEQVDQMLKFSDEAMRSFERCVRNVVKPKND